MRIIFLIKLKGENYLINAGQNAICDRLSFFMSEINACILLEKVNGRSQRVFMSYLAKVAGYELSFDKVTRDEYYEYHKYIEAKKDEELSKLNILINKYTDEIE